MILDLIQQDNLCLKHTGGDEYHGPCPWCGGDDRFMVWASKDKYFCRQCNAKGDSIQYLREFRKLSYFEAAEIVGNVTPAMQSSDAPIYKARPGAGWIENAEALVRVATSYLKAEPTIAADILKTRGITLATAEQFNLGWLPRNVFNDRAAWGMPEQLKENGEAKKLFVPSGLVIPSSDMQRIRVRRSEPGDHRKYYEVNGSSSAPFVINGDRPHDTTPALIVESELDAILLAQELRNPFLIIATSGASNGPSEEMAKDLRRRPFVLVSLDSDQAGGKAAWSRWLNVLRNACRAPIPPSWGKDHTEAHINGHDLNLWLSAAYEIVMEMNQEVTKV